MKVVSGSSGLARRAAVAGALIATIATISVGSPTAASVGYPPGAFTITLSASSVPPGSAVTASVAFCDPGVAILVSVDGTAIQQDAPCLPGAAGQGVGTPRATATFNAPTTPGQYTIRAAEVGGQGRSATAQLTVAVPQAPGGDLPATGGDAGDIAAYATAALVLGVGVVALARRQRLSSRS